MSAEVVPFAKPTLATALADALAEADRVNAKRRPHRPGPVSRALDAEGWDHALAVEDAIAAAISSVVDRINRALGGTLTVEQRIGIHRALIALVDEAVALNRRDR